MQEKFHAEDVLLEKNIMHVNLPFWFTLLFFFNVGAYARFFQTNFVNFYSKSYVRRYECL